MFTILGGDGREYGPESVHRIQRWIAEGRANLSTPAKAVGSEEWLTLGDFPEFGGSDVAAAAPPPIPEEDEEELSVAADEAPLADRWYRLGAWFIDNIVALICCLPGAMIVGVSVVISLIQNRSAEIPDAMEGPVGLGVFVMVLGGLVLFVLQASLLATRGQTVGKWVVGIRIVRYADGANPGFVSAVLMRAIVPGIMGALLSAIPLGGLVFSIVDSAFIFRADRRCVHDLIAGTRVVKI